MSRIHLRSHTLLLWLSLSAATTASLVSVGCSSSDDPGPSAAAGKGGASHSGGATGSAAGSMGEAGDPGAAGETQGPDDGGEGGRGETSNGGSTSSGGSGAAGGGVSGGAPSNGGGAGETGEGGAAGSPDMVDPEVAAAQERAITLIDSLATVRRCTSCHDVTYKGSGFYPNITPDVETGIGSWDEEDIKTAIREGKDKDGKTLCATMERYDFTDAQLSDIAIYLKHLPPITKKITGKCPSL